MVKRLLLLTIILLLSQITVGFSQITIGSVDAGPYTPGSSIAATFSLISNCIDKENTFELFLSDANGNFANEVRIGTYKGFYSTFVNGTIPPGTPAGTNYKLRVKSTIPVLTTTESAPFEIKTGSISLPELNSNSTISTSPLTFGVCEADENIPTKIYRFENKSNTGNVTVTIINELYPGAPSQTITFSTIGEFKTYTASLAHFTMLVKAIMPDGSIGTKAYFLINNLAVTAFTTLSGSTVCYPTGTFEYRVTTSILENGIGLNFPGNTYKIDWGDGTRDNFTYCEIVSRGNKVSHSFSSSSCNLQYQSGSETIYNAFAVNVGVISPFCDKIGAPISTPARVVIRPENRLFISPIACVNEDVSFINESVSGERPNTNSPGCVPNEMFYNWYIDGVLFAENVSVSDIIAHRFTTKGKYIIRLSSISDGGCQADDVEFEICIQDRPIPSFTLSNDLLCLSSPTITSNSGASIIDNTCSTTPIYTWTVNPSAGVLFNKNDVNPNFTFPSVGIYDITLSIANGTCAVSTLPQRVVVNSLPTATLPLKAELCALGNYTFDPNNINTKTTFTGTTVPSANTYTWTVSGSGGYSFTGTSTDNSQYPVINFQDYGTYTVTVTHVNNCGTATATEVITFYPAPTAKITASPPAICFNDKINLTGVITDRTPQTTYNWTGAGLFEYPDPDNHLEAIYTPTPLERQNGAASISLIVNTGITGTCSVVRDDITVTIYPNNIGDPLILRTQRICTGTNAVFEPKSTVAGSTFKWTAVKISGDVVGFSTSGSGKIDELLTNNSPTQDAVVQYTIIPVANQCDGESFTFTVTVTPNPLAGATPANSTICSNNQIDITLTSNLPNTTYTWTAISNDPNNIITINTNPLAPPAKINDFLINNGLAQGSVTYTITPYSQYGCPGTPVNVTVFVDPPITPPYAGQSQNVCDVPTYTLSGNTPKPGETGTWSLSSGPNAIVFSDVNLPNAIASGLVAGGTYIFKWTISAPGACYPLPNEVTIHVNEPTVAGSIDGATTVCSGTNTGQINLSGNTGSVFEWKSSIDDGATWQTAVGNNTSGTLTYNNLTKTTQYYAIVKNGSCPEANTNTIIITVAPPTTQAIAGPEQELCEATSAILSANSPGQGESGLWTYFSGPAAPTIPTPTNSQITVTDLVIGGTYVFKWTITGNAPCNPTESFVTIKSLKPIDQSISNPSPTICSGQTAHIIGTLPTGGNGSYTYVWQSKTPAGIWDDIPGQTAQNLDLLLTSDINIRRVVKSGSCTHISNETPITVLPPITNNIITANQTICNDETPILLTGTQPDGADGNFFYIWQSSIDGGTTWINLNSFRQDYQPGALTATTSYRRIVYTTICDGAQSSTSIPVTITVKPDAIALFTFTEDKDCAPFLINSTNVKAVEYPLINDTYTWYVNDVLHHVGLTFPDYTITGADQPITIKLVVTPKIGCKSTEFIHVFSTRQAVPASYTQSDTEICGPKLVRFVNTSIQSAEATFLWDFGNGQTSTQANPNPVNFLPDPTGKDITYTVTLTSTTVCGSNSVSSTVFVKAKPISVFSPDKTEACSPMLVTFTNHSPGGTNEYYYDFGDGSAIVKRTDKLPITHTYNTLTTKDFVVSMTAINGCGTDVTSYTIRVYPQNMTPELVVNGNEKRGCAPFTVNFHNNTIGASNFTFDFGDGGTRNTITTGIEQYTFTRPGTYTVKMTAFNSCSEITTEETIIVLEQPIPSFTSDVKLGCADLAVQFENNTQGGLSYIWDFGDGSPKSNELNPLHIYKGDQEYYTVTLTATNALGCSATISTANYIRVVPPPVAAFNVNPSTLISIPDYTFKFEDESTNNPTIWEWDFGDGVGVSALKNPSYTYLDTGTYKVTLKVTNQHGCFTTTFKNVTIKGVPGYLYVPNSFIPGSPRPELRLFKAKGSGIQSWQFSVFNKWGQLLWETSLLDEGRPAEGWDGTYKGEPMPQGVYYWKIDVKMINGSEWKGMTYDTSVPKRTGAIHLIR